MRTNLNTLAFIISAVLSLSIASTISLPFNGGAKKKIVAHIEKGDTLNSIAKKLESDKLIFSKTLFKLAAVLLGKSKNLKRGEYHIQNNVSIFQLLNILEKGSDIVIKITVPEGLRMKEIFSLLKKKGYNNSQKYLETSRDPEFIRSLDLVVEPVSLEGFIFPETYIFSKESSEKYILRTMVKTFFDNIPPDYAELARKQNLNFYEAVILASLIEKETGAPEERELIASVFYNRLKQRMRLQTDPAVIYGIKNFDGNLTRRQLQTQTPYNTYLINRLPPTPISNPGLASLMAAVKPAQTDYLYFVAKGDGSHKFSTNYREHAVAVSKFQLKRRKNYRSY